MEDQFEQILNESFILNDFPIHSAFTERIKYFEVCSFCLTILSLLLILIGFKGFMRQIFLMKALAGSLSSLLIVLQIYGVITFDTVIIEVITISHLIFVHYSCTCPYITA